MRGKVRGPPLRSPYTLIPRTILERKESVVTEMTPEERELENAKANVHAWDHALELLRPMLDIAALFGSSELMGLLERAEEEARREQDRAADVVESLLEKRGGL